MTMMHTYHKKIFICLIAEGTAYKDGRKCNVGGLFMRLELRGHLIREVDPKKVALMQIETLEHGLFLCVCNYMSTCSDW